MARSPGGGLLVLGLGNPIRHDDGVGIEVLRLGRERLTGLSGRVTFRALCAGGFDLLYEVVGYDGLIIVDSLYREGSVPGRVGLLGLEDLERGDAATTSPHLLGLPSALAWSERLGYETPSFLGAVAIEVGESCMVFGEGLSEPVRAAVPAAVELLCSVVREAAARTGPPSRPDEVRE